MRNTRINRAKNSQLGDKLIGWVCGSRKKKGHTCTTREIPDRFLRQACADALGIDESVLLDENVDFVLRANEQYGSTAMKQALNLVEDVRALWAGGDMEEEDMDEIMRALQEAYMDVKAKKKEGK